MFSELVELMAHFSTWSIISRSDFSEKNFNTKNNKSINILNIKYVDHLLNDYYFCYRRSARRNCRYVFITNNESTILDDRLVREEIWKLTLTLCELMGPYGIFEMLLDWSPLLPLKLIDSLSVVELSKIGTTNRNRFHIRRIINVKRSTFNSAYVCMHLTKLVFLTINHTTNFISKINQTTKLISKLNSRACVTKYVKPKYELCF